MKKLMLVSLLLVSFNSFAQSCPNAGECSITASEENKMSWGGNIGHLNHCMESDDLWAHYSGARVTSVRKAAAAQKHLEVINLPVGSYSTIKEQVCTLTMVGKDHMKKRGFLFCGKNGQKAFQIIQDSLKNSILDSRNTVIKTRDMKSLKQDYYGVYDGEDIKVVFCKGDLEQRDARIQDYKDALSKLENSIVESPYAIEVDLNLHFFSQFQY